MKLNKEAKILLWFHVMLFFYLVWFLFDLITVLNDTSAPYAFTQAELAAETTPETQMIPKIIHQTYKTTTIPEVWREGQQRCKDLNPDYQYILWTDEMARDFISEHYPWFLTTFDNYPYPIERADAIRYFVLAHFGGVYIDLDDGCNRNLDPLLNFPAFVRKTNPTGISNDVMGSIPQHPFFLKVIVQLEKFNINWLVPYITIMYSTGPLFLSQIWKQYIRWGEPLEIKILMPNDYKKGPNAFFKISPGSSWHKNDASLMFMMLNHLPLTIVLGFLLVIFLICCEYLLVCVFVKYLGPYVSKLNTIVLDSYEKFTASRSQIKWKKLPQSGGDNYPKNQIRKPRKDSNLPRAIIVDLEKNVSVVDFDHIAEESS